MANYVERYGIIAKPLHELTRKAVVFPKPWVAGADYDVAFYKLKAAMLDGTNYSWNKDSSKRLFLEVDASDVGWGCCAFQFGTPYTTDDEGKERLLDKSKRRVIEWISKAWTTDQLKLPVFYRESLARLLCLEKYRNLIETNIDSGITLYTDHMPSLYAESLSNKGQLSEWRIAEVADLNSIVQTLHQAGPRMALADPLSRLCSPSGGLYDMALPAKMATLLKHLPDFVRGAKSNRVHANNDTAAAARIVQKWRRPTNPISQTQLTAGTKTDFIFGFPHADRGTHRISQLLQENRAFACLHPTSLINEIPVENTGINKEVAEKLRRTRKIVLSSYNLTWIINLPGDAADSDSPMEHMVYLIHPSFNQSQLLAKSTTTYPEALHNATPISRVALGCSDKEAATEISASLRQIQCTNDIHPETNLQRHDLFVALRSGRSTTASPDSGPAEAPSAPSPPDVPASVSWQDPVDDLHTRTLRSGTATDRTPQDPEAAASAQYVPPANIMPASSTIEIPHLKRWVGKQTKHQTFSKENLDAIKISLPGYPTGLKLLCRPNTPQRIIVPLRFQERLIRATHEEILHLGYPKVQDVLKKLYYWPKMDSKIEIVVRECIQCIESTVRRKHLASHFDARSKTSMHYPRHSYGIDFYGVYKGEILTAVDLCTREVQMWWLPDRNQKRVASALINGLIFQRGVPTCLRSDNAPELMQGVVRDINSYLNIAQITTGGHNPRGNAICERVNQMIGAMLRKCKDSQYKNLKEYLPAMSFAINTTKSSTLNCTPFEAGHGLPARTVATARSDSARLQFNLEGGTGDNTLEDISNHFDTSLHKAMLELSMTLANTANGESEWHRRMTSQKLNQTGKKVAEDLLKLRSKVYFYKPPSQQETNRLTRKAKHCQHYHGPASIKKKIGRHSYEIEYQGRTYQCDQGMIIPAKHYKNHGRNTVNRGNNAIPAKHSPDNRPIEGEYVLLKDSATSPDWYCAQIEQVLVDRIKVSYHTTAAPPLPNYGAATTRARENSLYGARFLRTWIKQSDGTPTTTSPRTSRIHKDLYFGRIPNPELDDHLLIRNVSISSRGKLSPDTIRLAAALAQPHHLGAGGNDDFA